MNKDNVRKLLNNCSKKELIELIFEIQKYSRSEFALNEFISLKTGEEKEKILQNAFKFSKVPVCVNNYEYIYDFSNKVTVCHDKYFNELTAKLFSNEDYNSVFYEDIKN